MEADSDHEHDIRVSKAPATVDCDNELEFWVAASAV